MAKKAPQKTKAKPNQNKNNNVPTKKAAKAESSKKAAKKDIQYHNITATCACGAEFETGSTSNKIHVDICSKCHPFFTGDKRILDTEGRVEKFLKKYNLNKDSKS